MFPLRRQFLPHRGVDRSMADDLQTPHEFDALEQRQGRRRRGPVVTREPFVAQNGVHFSKVPEDMWIAFNPTLTPARYIKGRTVDKIMAGGMLVERACMEAIRSGVQALGDS